MPTPKSISQFPRQWVELISAVAVQGRSVTVRELGGQPLTKGQAAKLRFRFYAIRSLLRKDPIQQDTANLAECVEATIGADLDRGGSLAYSVLFSRRDANREALALEKAIGEGV